MGSVFREIVITVFFVIKLDNEAMGVTALHNKISVKSVSIKSWGIGTNRHRNELLSEIALASLYGLDISLAITNALVLQGEECIDNLVCVPYPVRSEI